MAAFVRIKSPRLVPFQSAASSEYFLYPNNVRIEIPRKDRHAGRRHFRTSYAILQPHSWGQSGYPRQARHQSLGKTNGKPNIVTRPMTR